MLGAVITLFFSLKIFPDVEEFACDKKIFQMIENYVREPLKKAPLLAIRGLDRSDPIPWNVVRRLANVTPTKHLLLEGWLSDLPEQEGEGLRDYSDITFNKINLGRTLIKYLIDFSVAKLSALRYIGEDCTKKGREWKDPLQFVFDLSSQGECLETLCIGLSRPSIGYMSGPRLPHMGMLKKLTHLWIDSDSTVQRWQALDIMEFFWRLDPQPNDTSPLFGNPPNLVDLRVIGHPDDVRRWVDHVRGYVLDPDSKVWETLKKIGIRDATRLERYNKDLAGKIDFYLIGEDEDIKLWRIGGHTRRRQFWEVVIEE
ncbi:hypothetical protein JMJ77_0013755 [Colletotrichum scovillei]|uniref:Uncharacterized protein n=2 Tax=Colletotrichum scovillei TaxID=1209932 RepID=A0A9P7R216_9PEZI|nr:hypothetical protein JMJ77_0013755 [Colletotrichum scovillei]KAG7065274.1 hypothetical protein JMJ78_0012030 [Colletotrichum scovillei]KAG7067876.1 hypothetical protein JMJ76_0007575 [Colletotrichum scovillei]